MLFFVLLGVLPIIRQFTDSNLFALFDSFYRSGALVFGGGHVVLPLLQTEVVPTGWLTAEQFLAGYGAKTSSARTVVYIRIVLRNG